MSPSAPPRKRLPSGPRYYRTAPIWALVFMLALVIALIAFLLRVG